jgi:hypothetical protein
VTEKYGFAIQTGAVVALFIKGVVWLVVAWQNMLQASFKDIPVWRWFLMPFALLVF